MKPVELGIVVVAYKHPERTADYINSQLPYVKGEYRVVVVNNASTWDECCELAGMVGGVACSPDDMEIDSKVVVVHSAENLGYAKGNNLGVRFLSRNTPAKYILFSNDDIIIGREFDMRPMFDIMEADKRIAAIGPNVVGVDGVLQSPKRRKITAYRQIGWILFSKLRKRRDPVAADSVPQLPEEGQCYWLSGCFFVVRTGDFAAVNGFDPETFLYSEEVILAERFKKIGRHMYFYPGLSVTHLEGASTKAVASSDFIRRNLVESNCIYFRKYLGTFPPVVWLYRFLSR